jgi:hypothetical protein
MWRAFLGVVGLVVCVIFGGCELPIEDVPPDEYEPTVCYNPPECAVDEKNCAGNVTQFCGTDFDGCFVWRDFKDCGAIGGTCSNGGCVLPGGCPADANLFCRDGTLVGCTNGAIDVFTPCGSPDSCKEFADENGQKSAACAAPDGPCINDAASSAECRGDDRITCSSGQITARDSCGGTGCSLVVSATNEVTAVCGAGG